MAKKVLHANVLSVASLRALEKELEKYADSLTFKCREFAERCAERGVEIARVQIANLDAIFTGELIQSIHAEYKDSAENKVVFAVVADSLHACYVEFGTGWKGLNSPYPYPMPEGISWNYNTGETIQYNKEKGTYYWFYPGKDGLWHYTEGMPARPFLYNTSLELQREIGNIAKEIFSK